VRGLRCCRRDGRYGCCVGGEGRMSGNIERYEAFLRDKVAFDRSFGWQIDDSAVNPMLLPHQRDIVKWAVAGGRRAIFAAFGLGKTFMQLETLRLVVAEKGGSALLVAPYGVRPDIIADAAKLGVDVEFIQRVPDELVDGRIYLTNYEPIRDGKLDPSAFTAVSLDEASILRSFGSKTYQTFLPLFDDVEFRFVATATPSPNRYKELIHYAGFLGIMDTGQALTRFFQRDSTKANNLKLYPHKEREFYLWLNTWAVFVQRPSDLGYSDDGYALPPIDVRFHEVSVEGLDTPVDRDGQGQLFRGAQLGVAEAAKEKRDTLPMRVAKLAELVAADPDDHFILWHDLEDERRAIAAAVPGVSEVYGSLDLEERERRVVDFADGRTRLLATKPILSGSGCNFQRHCHRAIFVGVDFKFNDWIQAIHRIQRFQQPEPVRIDIVHAESEREVVRILMEKWQQHEALTSRMSDVLREFGLNPAAISAELTRTMGVDRVEESGDGWTVAHNDCVPETMGMDENSVDLIVTSIPFSNHYEYTPSYNDFGHTDDNAHFWAQMDFLTPELYRVLKPGRIYACHVKDRILFGSVTGAGVPTVSPFHAEALFHGQKHGFDYLGMITVVTDVVRENNQTYRLGYTEMRKDGSKMGVGSPEYILLFHKAQTDRAKGYADEPIRKDVADYSLARWQVDAHAFWRSSGNRHLTPDELVAMKPEDRSRFFTEQTLREVYDFGDHVSTGEALNDRHALPSTFMSLAPGSWHPDVWHDVNRMQTLNGEQSRRNLEFHICPLQFDIVDRLIERYSNAGDLVYDPFGGLFTVPLRALKLGRRGRAAELNPNSFRDGLAYLRQQDRKQELPTLFDMFDVDGAA
jgi:hypothetical protein